MEKLCNSGGSDKTNITGDNNSNIDNNSSYLSSSEKMKMNPKKVILIIIQQLLINQSQIMIKQLKFQKYLKIQLEK